MGLEITTYSNIKKTDAVVNNDGDIVDLKGNHTKKTFLALINHDFPERAKDLTDGAIYTYEDSMQFWAGTYSSYGEWRNQLAKLAGYEADIQSEDKPYVHTAWKRNAGPFSELLNFSDCEGFIGAEVSKKLLQDFIDFEDKAREVGDIVYKKFSLFKEAFELAANNGAVSFH